MPTARKIAPRARDGQAGPVARRGKMARAQRVGGARPDQACCAATSNYGDGPAAVDTAQSDSARCASPTDDSARSTSDAPDVCTVPCEGEYTGHMVLLSVYPNNTKDTGINHRFLQSAGCAHLRDRVVVVGTRKASTPRRSDSRSPARDMRMAPFLLNPAMVGVSLTQLEDRR